MGVLHNTGDTSQTYSRICVPLAEEWLIVIQKENDL